MTTPNLKRNEWAGAQDQPWATVNGALHVIDALSPGSVVSDALSTPPASPTAGACYIVAAAATGAWAGWEGRIAAYIGGAWEALINEAPEDGTAYARQDGAWVAVSVTGGIHDLPLSFAGTPTTSEVMQRYTIVREVTCAANFAGSFGDVGTNPTASFAIDVQAAGVSIGTITIATDGSFSFSTTGGLAQVIAAGSLITFIAPATVDATIANISPTLLGNA